MAIAVEAVERSIDGIRHEVEPRLGKQVFIGNHTYQPPRELLLPTRGQRLYVLPEVNERIYKSVYKPLLVEDGNVARFTYVSLYAPLRDWMAQHHPEALSAIKEKAQKNPDRIFGDPYIHAVLPLLPVADQDMLVKLGKEAMKRDLGIEPSFMWLPETAVSKTTLDVLQKNGYRGVVLRGHQLMSREKNPMFVKTSHGEIAVIHTDQGLGDSVSFEEGFTSNGDEFYERLKGSDRKTLAFATDIETYGGYDNPEKAYFLKYISQEEIAAKHDFSPIDISKALDDPNRKYTEVVENSSWSCPHNLGRWTGENPDCKCGDSPESPPTEERMNEKRWLIATLRNNHGNELNRRLSEQDPNWRDEFVVFFLNIRKVMFAGGNLTGREDPLLLAKACQLIGMTSCAWFYSKAGGTETLIAHAMNTEIPELMRRAEATLPKAA